jgi:hypothetical protein
MKRLIVETSDIDRIEIGFKCFVIFKTSHALGSVEPEVIKDLNIKIIYLVKKDREVFIQSFCEENASVEQNFCLLRFVEVGKGAKCHRLER